jgi:hypothetical protein
MYARKSFFVLGCTQMYTTQVTLTSEIHLYFSVNSHANSHEGLFSCANGRLTIDVVFILTHHRPEYRIFPA